MGSGNSYVVTIKQYTYACQNWFAGHAARKKATRCKFQSKAFGRCFIMGTFSRTNIFLQNEDYRVKASEKIMRFNVFLYCVLTWSLIYRVSQKMVIKLWSALARSLYNLQKSFFHRRKDQAFSFRMSPFLWNLKKDWANTNQMKIAGQNHIFPPLSIIMASNKKRKFH